MSNGDPAVLQPAQTGKRREIETVVSDRDLYDYSHADFDV